MDFKTGIGKPGLALAVLCAIAMCVLSLLFRPVEVVPLEYGICLPSPDCWNIPAFWSWLINAVIVGVIAILLWLINRSYNFIRTTEPAAPAIFLFMVCSSPWFTQSLNTSVILCLSNLICLGIIFGSYDTRNATQQMFILGVVCGLGSMFQYAFLSMAIIYFLWAVIMKVVRVKEILSFFAGILCPYWIALGVGWVHFSEVHFPSLMSLLETEQNHAEMWLLLTGVGLAASMGFILSFVNSIKLYAGNSKVNAMNLCVSVMGAVSVVCILVDFDNLPAYIVTLYLACAVQLANICALWNPKMPWIVTAVPAILYLAIFICSIVL